MDNKLNDAAKRLMEEQLYEVVADEIKNRQIREGLMAKALAETAGNMEQAQALYIKYRVQSIIDESNLAKAEAEAKAEAQAEAEAEAEAEGGGAEARAEARADAKSRKAWQAKGDRKRGCLPILLVFFGVYLAVNIIVGLVMLLYLR